MIVQDSITRAFTVIALMAPIYLATFEKVALAELFFPVILLLSGLVLNLYLHKKIPDDTTIDPMERREIALYSLYAFVGISIAKVSPTRGLVLTVGGSVLFAVFMAVAEEQFFRGALTKFLALKYSRPLAILGSGALFAVYHLSRGTSPEWIMFTFGAGAALAWVALRSNRLTPCIIGHTLWNSTPAIVEMLVGGI